MHVFLPQGRTWPRLAAALILTLVCLFPGAAGSQVAAAGTGTGVVAYVVPNDATGDEIWLAQPDGTQAHKIWSTNRPDPNHIFHIDSLAWNFQGTELAFTSNHEDDCSFYEADIFSIRPDGSGYRRITQSPSCAELAGYPQGSVTVPVVNDTLNSGTFWIYIQGAQTVQQISLAPSASGQVTFDKVADLGNGTQFAIALDGTQRYYNLAGADVVAGGHVTADQTLHVGGNGLQQFGAYWPAWRPSGDRIAYVLGLGTFYSIPSHPAVLELGTRLLANNASTLLFGNRLQYSPLNANQFIYDGWDGVNDAGIYLDTEGSSNEGQQLVNLPCCDQFRGLTWTPDGKSILYSRTEQNDFFEKVRGNVFEYDLATKQSKRVTDFPDTFAHTVTIAPDGQHIVFEVSSAYSDNAHWALWIANRDGSNAHLFKDNAVMPAWSPRDIPQNQKLYLPLIVK